jgi:hypothetical protein
MLRVPGPLDAFGIFRIIGIMLESNTDQRKAHDAYADEGGLEY